jgi:hypothetical protein
VSKIALLLFCLGLPSSIEDRPLLQAIAAINFLFIQIVVTGG